jgi:1-phosphofructokinase
VIVTVTLNPAIDKTLIVPAFRPGATNRATVDRVAVGGKGINVALNLRRLGCEVVATGFAGADDRHSSAAILARHGVEADFVTVAGETRVNLKLLDSTTGVETEINEPGFIVPPDALAALAAKLRAVARRASVMVFSGSLPPGAPADLYSQLIAQAGAQGVRTVLDTAGAALAHGIAAGPDLAKPNRAEAEELLHTSITDEESLVAAAQRMLGLGARSVVVSLGSRGAFGASSAGMWRARPPAVSARSTVGAGDAMVAALAYGLQQALPASDAIRLATAVSCAAAAASGPFGTTEAIESLLPQVSIASVPKPFVSPISPLGNR